MLVKALYVYSTLFLAILTAATVEIHSMLDLFLVALMLLFVPAAYFWFLQRHVYIHHKRFKFSSGLVVKGQSALLPVICGICLGYACDMPWLLTAIGFGISTILLFVLSLHR